MMPFCMIIFSCLPCHVYFNSMSFVSMFALIVLFMQCSKVCLLMLADCARNLFCLYLLAVTPFGVFFICNLISFSCTLWLCCCWLLLTNLKYGLGQNITKSFMHREALSVMPCLGCCLA